MPLQAFISAYASKEAQTLCRDMAVADGNLSLDHITTTSSDAIRHIIFIDVWENRYQPYRDRSWMKTGECADCKYFRYCQGNGIHLRDENGELILCHLKRLDK